MTHLPTPPRSKSFGPAPTTRRTSRSVSEPGQGRVFLVGAGPGDPDLITVRGLRCLEQADVVIHDRLIHPDLLDLAPAGANRIYVGKAPGHHAMDQEKINQLLVRLARAGRTVVRLKGGDPLVFGRGGEEALELAEAGVPFEIVPGVSSSVGVPGRVGIPVTHRKVAASFAVVTAHRAAGQDAPDWQALARIDTLVVLMGVRQLPEVVAQLLHHGRDGATPAAIVEHGTMPDERVFVGRLDNLHELAADRRVCSPAAIVIGEVVNLRERLKGALSKSLSVAESQSARVDAPAVVAPALGTPTVANAAPAGASDSLAPVFETTIRTANDDATIDLPSPPIAFAETASDPSRGSIAS